MKTRLKVLILVSLCVASEGALARTIQFAGVATTFGIHPISGTSQYIACSIVIANTGAQNQFVSNVTFNSFNATSGQLSRLSSDGIANLITQEDIYNPPNTTATPICSTTTGAVCTYAPPALPALPSPPAAVTILPGGFYIATMQQQIVPQTSYVVVPCSGSFSVGDADPRAPGSMVAAGAISFVGEQALTGGQLMGAIYMSGSHVPAVDSTRTTQAPLWGGSLPAADGSMQMNLYCQKACTDSGGHDRNRCAALCGGGDGEGSSATTQIDDILPSAHRTRNFTGLLEEHDVQQPGLDISYLVNHTTSPMTYSKQTFANDSYGPNPSRIAEHPFHNNSSVIPNAPIRALHRYANPHFNGGHVIEMIMGPFETICSGNTAYWTNGGSEFDHQDSIIQTDTAFRTSVFGNGSKGPPERLYCSHGHNQPGPYGYVAHSTSFAILGGSAF